MKKLIPLVLVLVMTGCQLIPAELVPTDIWEDYKKKEFVLNSIKMGDKSSLCIITKQAGSSTLKRTGPSNTPMRTTAKGE